jgi:hypothetical protein
MSLAVLLLAVQQLFLPANWAPDTMEVSPEHPTASSRVAITVGGTWGNSCAPNESLITVAGQSIYFTAIHSYPPHIVCATVITSWHLTEEVGPLSPGTYTVYARLISMYPYDPNEILVLPGESTPYSRLGQFRVMTETPASCDMDWDGAAVIVGDVPAFVRLVYFGHRTWYEQEFAGQDPLLPGDCNDDGILSIIGDVPCFVDCVYFGNCAQ